MQTICGQSSNFDGFEALITHFRTDEV